MKSIFFTLVAVGFVAPAFGHNNYEQLGKIAAALKNTKAVSKARAALMKDGYSLHANQIIDFGEAEGTEKFLTVEVYEKKNQDAKQQDGGTVRHADEKVLTFVADVVEGKISVKEAVVTAR